MNLFELSDGFKRAGVVLKKAGISTKQYKAVYSNTVIKRSGCVVKDVQRVPVVEKKVVEFVDKTTLSCDGLLDCYDRRKALGKRVYDEREDIIHDLVHIYKVEKESLIRLSLVKLRNILLKWYANDSKISESLLLMKDDSKEAVGNLFESLVIVSTIDSKSVAWEQLQRDGEVTKFKPELPNVHSGLVVGTCRKCGSEAVRDNKIEDVLYWCSLCCEYSK